VSYTVALDIGGTKTAFAAVKDAHILARQQASTPQDTAGFLAMLCQGIEELMNIMQAPMDKIGIGFPGACQKGVVLYASNLLFLNGVDIKGFLQNKYRCPVYMENDANCAALGEYLYGALQGAHTGLMVTLGTGVGGGCVIEGKVVSGAMGCACEVGHLPLVPNGLPCGCGQNGCLEQYVSTTALLRMAKNAAEQIPQSGLMQLVKQDALNGKTFFRALQQNDPAAQQALEEFLFWLEKGLLGLCNIFNPDIIAIGGGISRDFGEICRYLHGWDRLYC